ncbi:MAG TPA: hypothetical protein VKV80_19205 [Streptosporangiaceae bacterium]|nr:hypothetical protein [Streptosporangiaceae bacterium]
MRYDEELPQRPPMAVAAALEALRDAFRDYRADLIRHRDGTWHFELTRRGDGPGPWCLISGSPRKIYDTLTNSQGAQAESQDT